MGRAGGPCHRRCRGPAMGAFSVPKTLLRVIELTILSALVAHQIRFENFVSRISDKGIHSRDPSRTVCTF
jgi:hypothetical protein